jgi:hypothetical protein
VSVTENKPGILEAKCGEDVTWEIYPGTPGTLRVSTNHRSMSNDGMEKEQMSESGGHDGGESKLNWQSRSYLLYFAIMAAAYNMYGSN